MGYMLAVMASIINIASLYCNFTLKHYAVPLLASTDDVMCMTSCEVHVALYSIVMHIIVSLKVQVYI